MKRLQRIVALCGLAAALVAALMPDWVAVHPTDEALRRDAGHGWLWSPPAPPAEFGGMVVVIGSDWFLTPTLILGGTAILVWFLGSMSKLLYRD